MSSQAGGTFHFIWDCTFILDSFTNHLKHEASRHFPLFHELVRMTPHINVFSQINITEFEFDPTMKSMMKRELRDLLDPFINQANSYRLLWSRHLSRLPVHKDLARLSGHIEIVDRNGEIVRATVGFFLLRLTISLSLLSDCSSTGSQMIQRCRVTRVPGTSC